MSETENRAKAAAALAAIKDAIVAEVIASSVNGLGAAEVAWKLGLETSFRGGQRKNLTHALLNSPVEDGPITRSEQGHLRSRLLLAWMRLLTRQSVARDRRRLSERQSRKLRRA